MCEIDWQTFHDKPRNEKAKKRYKKPIVCKSKIYTLFIIKKRKHKSVFNLIKPKTSFS